MSLVPLLLAKTAAQKAGSNLQLRLLSTISDPRRRHLAVAVMSTPTVRPLTSTSLQVGRRMMLLSPKSMLSKSSIGVGWQPVRHGGDHHGPRKMVIRPSQHYWTHFWDDFHFYILLGVIPCGLLAIYLYIFVGPAELTEIPEGYEPQEYEYHRHPLTRFLAWFKTHAILSEQEAYERFLAYNNEERLRMTTKMEYRSIKNQESLLGDYRGFYFIPVNPRSVSQHHSHRQLDDLFGDLPHGFQSEDPRELPTKIDAPKDQF